MRLAPRPRHLAIALGACAVVYFEPVAVFGVKFSHLWKVAFESMLLVLVLYSSRASSGSESAPLGRWSGYPRSLVAGLLWAAWPCAGALNYEDPASSLFVFGQRAFLPIILMACLAGRLFREEMLRFLAAVVVAVVLTALPFVFGVIEPLGERYDLEYIFLMPVEAFIGIFQEPHGASNILFFVSVTALAFSMISRGRRYRILWTAAFLAAAFLLFKTCVRTGMLSFVVGSLVFVVATRRLSWSFAGAILLAAVIGLVFLTIEDMQGVLNRLTGGSTGRVSLSIDEMSSGRLMAWESTLRTVGESDLLSFFVGNGPTAVLEGNMNRIGMRIIAHNAFIDELAAYGIVGLALLFNFLRAVLADIRRIDRREIAALGLALLCGTIAFGVFQSFDYPLPLSVLVPFVAYAYAPSREAGEEAWYADRDVAVA